jgi:hypothetical protein
MIFPFKIKKVGKLDRHACIIQKYCPKSKCGVAISK